MAKRRTQRALRGGTKARFKWASGSSLEPRTQVRLPEVS